MDLDWDLDWSWLGLEEPHIGRGSGKKDYFCFFLFLSSIPHSPFQVIVDEKDWAVLLICALGASLFVDRAELIERAHFTLV